MSEAPVGVFDSGVGGLSVLKEIHTLLPNESLLYVADCGHIPYGEKSPEFIRQRCAVVADFFQRQGAKALVLACNTATVAGVADLRQLYPEWPIVGMEPAVKPAAAATRSGVVGVLATTGTLQSAKFAALLDRFASDVRVITQPCPGLVELIETGDLAYPTATRERLAECHEPHWGMFPKRLAVPGNHDWRDDEGRGFFGVYPEPVPRAAALGPENAGLLGGSRASGRDEPEPARDAEAARA